MILIDAYHYALAHQQEVQMALGQHLYLVILPLGLALALGSSLGWLCAHWSRQSAGASFFALAILNTFHGFRVIPSLAILFLVIPYLGLTFKAAAFALTLLAIPPILLATEVGLRTVAPHLREVGQGLGMTPWQLFWQVDVPLALPLFLAGAKTATIEVIASATLAAFIGAGGLGQFITLGFALNEPAILLVGAIPVAVLALAAEHILGSLQRMVTPQILNHGYQFCKVE